MFAWLELRTHCHATEDESKIEQVMAFLCPSVKSTKKKFEGYHKNPLLVFKSRTEKKKAIKEFWELLDSHGLVQSILQSMEKRLDRENILHFRLGKQETYIGRPTLADDDDVVVVRLKVVAFSTKKRDMLDATRDTITELIGKNVSDS